jgi:hypothetical protein
VCDQKERNHRAVQSLNAMMSKNVTPTLDGSLTFQNIFAKEGLGVKIFENVFGDGWDGQCPCRLCKQDWLNAGWVCTARYYRYEYLAGQSAARRAAVFLAIQFEHHPPPDNDLLDTAGSAQTPPAPPSRRHSRSRSRSRSSRRSSVVQPAHIR